MADNNTTILTNDEAERLLEADEAYHINFELVVHGALLCTIGVLGLLGELRRVATHRRSRSMIVKGLLDALRVSNDLFPSAFNAVHDIWSSLRHKKEIYTFYSLWSVEIVITFFFVER